MSLNAWAICPVAAGGLEVKAGEDKKMLNVRRILAVLPESLNVGEVRQFDPSLVIVHSACGTCLSGQGGCTLASVVVGWTTYCKVPLVCYKCQHFDKHTVHCKVEKPTCGCCGEEGHDFCRCPKHKGGSHGPMDHRVTSKDCTVMKRAMATKIDLQKSTSVMTELNALLLENIVDVSLVQGPYSSKSKFAGLTGLRSSVGEHPMAGVMVKNPALDVFVLKHLSYTHHESVQISTSGKSILHELSGKRVILCADVNAMGQLWHSLIFEHSKGERLTEFIVANNLYVKHLAGQLSTFISDAHGTESNIYVALTFPSAA
ncbi:hypothetical protein PR048_006008 [Dryococelus australis]|uniref:Uncharacterized protein n=1 Tax=Dryococelus australis TaxID=614101 RepID=A0ABQ9I9S4_9NEOP|nr:hypothetical protein PR048_006008 [Dryococelus australis]